MWYIFLFVCCIVINKHEYDLTDRGMKSVMEYMQKTGSE